MLARVKIKFYTVDWIGNEMNDAQKYYIKSDRTKETKPELGKKGEEKSRKKYNRNRKRCTFISFSTRQNFS